MPLLGSVSGMRERRFQLPPYLGGTVVFSVVVLAHMYGNAQRRVWQKEAGGQIFSPNPHESEVLVTSATGPYPEDQRNRHRFIPNIRRIRFDAMQSFTEGMHSIGLWHTHPEAKPSPSSMDEATTREYLAGHSAEMAGFLLVTLGNEGPQPNMSVYFVGRRLAESWIPLIEITELNFGNI